MPRINALGYLMPDLYTSHGDCDCKQCWEAPDYEYEPDDFDPAEHGYYDQD